MRPLRHAELLSCVWVWFHFGSTHEPDDVAVRPHPSRRTYLVGLDVAHAQQVEDGLPRDLREDRVLLIEPLARVKRHEELRLVRVGVVLEPGWSPFVSALHVSAKGCGRMCAGLDAEVRG